MLRAFLAANLLIAGCSKAHPLESSIAAAAAFFHDKGLVSDGDYMPLLVRLAFHDCVGVGGCDGCLDMSDPENAGLERILAVLLP
eukprot:gene21244-10389_t